MKKVLIIFFLLSACSSNNINKENSLSTLDFSENLTIEEFKLKLEQYANNSNYPNIDN
tara:strand:+ start:1056 stop:1229 length:174 start_codon:yes stop_codon:yes gene_type:complete